MSAPEELFQRPYRSRCQRPRIPHPPPPFPTEMRIGAAFFHYGNRRTGCSRNLIVLPGTAKSRPLLWLHRKSSPYNLNHEYLAIQTDNMQILFNRKIYSPESVLCAGIRRVDQVIDGKPVTLSRPCTSANSTNGTQCIIQKNED